MNMTIEWNRGILMNAAEFEMGVIDAIRDVLRFMRTEKLLIPGLDAESMELMRWKDIRDGHMGKPGHEWAEESQEFFSKCPVYDYTRKRNELFNYVRCSCGLIFVILVASHEVMVDSDYGVCICANCYANVDGRCAIMYGEDLE